MDSIHITVTLAHDPAERTGPHGSFVAVDAFHNLSRRNDQGGYEQVAATVYHLTAPADSGIGRKMLSLGKGSVITVATRFLTPAMWTPDKGQNAGVPQLSIKARVRSLAVVNEKAPASPSTPAAAADTGELAALQAQVAQLAAALQGKTETERSVAEEMAEDAPF